MTPSGDALWRPPEYANSPGGDPDFAQRACFNAMKWFRSAGEPAKEMLARAEVVQRQATAWDAVKACGEWGERERLAAGMATELVAVGLIKDARRLCRLASDDPTVVAPLLARLDALDDSWRALGIKRAEQVAAGSSIWRYIPSDL